MFLKNSRYSGLPTVVTQDRSGREVVAVKLRRLPATAGDARTIQGHDRLDVMSDAQYGDATRYWRIADANTELEAEELTRTAGRVISVPNG
jgi:nucleoid-associated protein YgaU